MTISKNKCCYGCGQDGIHLFKNGRWCCSLSSNSCPVVRKKIGSSLKGTRFGKNNPNYGNIHSSETKEKMRK